MPSKALTIGQVAKQAGLGTKAIRFYEGKGLLSPASRGENSYRLYGPDAVDVPRFIKQAQTMGLTLAEIREIIGIRQGGRPPCQHVHTLLTQKADELDRKLADLLTLRRRIRSSLNAWGRRARGPAAVCPHIETASVDARPSRARARPRRGPSHGTG
jgi:MerR family copper efflux transcriptional regulator